MIRQPPWGYDQTAAVELYAMLLASNAKGEHWVSLTTNRRNQFRLEAHKLIEEALDFWEKHRSS